LLCAGRDPGTKIRARFLAEFTLSTQSEILLPRMRDQGDSEGLGMTANFKAGGAGGDGPLVYALMRLD